MFTIETYFLSTLQKRVDKVNRRAEKLGVDGVTLEVSEPYEHEFWHDSPARGYVKYIATAVDVEVTGPEVKLEGWTFLASIDHFENLVRTTPAAEETNLHAYTEKATCDHCDTNRDRKNTYVLRHDNGELKQVGSTCIKDFLGHTVSLGMLFPADDIESEFEGGYAAHVPAVSPLIEALTITASVIRTEGWVPRSQSGYGTPATADEVAALLWANDKYAVEARNKLVVTDKDEELAKAAMVWATEIEARNDYLANLRQIATNDFVTPKSLGFAASMLSAYSKAMERELEYKLKRETEAAEASPVPVTDERIEVEGTIVKVSWKQGYGYYDDAVKKIIVRDDRGFKLWGTCPKAIIQADRGDRVKFTAKIERGDRDESFGFFNRPTKPELVAEATEEVNA